MNMNGKPEIMSAWDFMARFPTDKDAREHIERMRWGDEPICAHCGSRRISRVANEKPQPYRCKDCRKHFSVTTGTVFHSANLSPRKCLYAIYLMVVAKKSISSCQMARELGCTQKTAWYLAQRIRETWLNKSVVGDPMAGEVEVDETYVGGRERNKHASKKLRAGRGPVGKIPVVGMRERKSGRVKARPVAGTDAAHLQSAVRSEVMPGSTLYTDGHRAPRRTASATASPFGDGRPQRVTQNGNRTTGSPRTPTENCLAPGASLTRTPPCIAGMCVRVEPG